jgi:hypothetical protein
MTNSAARIIAEEQLTRHREVTRLERGGFVDRTCPGCAEVIAAVLAGEVPSFPGPGHKPSSYCESGKRPHCSCDRCF